MKDIYWGNTPINATEPDGDSGIVHRDGEPWYKIANYQQMPPFFIAVVSGYDHWMFLSSTGGLTGGRRNPDNALFPYTTDDKTHDAAVTTGSKTNLLVEKGDRTYLWKPFVRGVATYALERNLYKNLVGNKLVFEEINHDLGLAFSYCWSNGERFGFIKRSNLRNLVAEESKVTIMDGLRNLLPYGISQQAQNERSTLLDGYKQAERVPGTSAGIFTLSSILTDRAEPCEALKATLVWSAGLDGADVLLSEDQSDAFCTGAGVRMEEQSRGKRSAFFAVSSFPLASSADKTWYIVADVNQGPVQVPALLRDIRSGVSRETIEADIDAGTQRLVQLVGGADGCQFSSDALVTARHFSNTLFNIMRGGTFYDGYNFPSGDFLDFVDTWNAPLHKPFADLLEAQGTSLKLHSVLRAAADSGVPDMERLALEYLPLTFSRRHGDPSRPWNRFSIDIKNADGSDKLHFEGNWRDIFQNWEALSLSYPEYIESFIAKFVNASTADGYNPYRITRDGIDWEVLEPDNPWSNIGYWGDHQINYLVKLIELSLKYHPGKLHGLLEREIFVYANVPYRIRGYADLVADPRNTVVYDDEEEVSIADRVETLGSDGKLLSLHDGSIYRVNLLEKLLLPALAKLGNFVPAGGIWMNTQRPEWNDANNALVGYGLSMVTLCYLRRYLKVLADILTDHSADQYLVSEEVRKFFTAIDSVLRQGSSLLESNFTPDLRKQLMDGLGLAGEQFRERVYAGLSGNKKTLDKTKILRFIDLALEFFDHSIAGNRRADGLFHSYNLIHFADDGFEVEHLSEMLEGQVAVLSSGYLGAREGLALLGHLRASKIYRPDQNSYLLYPDREQVRFLEKNIIPGELLESNDWLARELASARTDFVEQDVDGTVHFNGSFRNSADLVAALERHPDIGPEDAVAVCEAYETVFEHRRFTGRSGSMFKYEGLGCIYWHMVSKLLLATAEVLVTALQGDTDATTTRHLFERFDEIKDGLGMHKSPAEYGAFPTDPYSHTPGFAGVQQPGMTGQVKEDVITRFAELGASVENGELAFVPAMLRRAEFTTQAATWSYSVGQDMRSEQLEPGSLAFSVCGVPLIYRLGEQYTIRIVGENGDEQAIAGNRLGRDRSQSLFRRDGRIRKLVVEIPRDELR